MRPARQGAQARLCTGHGQPALYQGKREGFRTGHGPRTAAGPVRIHPEPARCQHPGQLWQQQLDDCARHDHNRPPHSGQRPAPRARRAQPALHLAHLGPRHGRDRCGRAVSARHLHRPQRPHCLRPDALLHGPGRPVRVRDQPAKQQGIQVPGPLGAHDPRHGNHCCQRRGQAGHRGELVHAPRPGAGRRKQQGLRPARSLAGPGHGALLRLDGLHAGAELRPVPRRDEPLGRSGREPGLCRQQRQHWLDSRRPDTHSPQLGRADTRAR
ncbi:hypothetical protein D3C72_1278770 [compost metagenome]